MTERYQGEIEDFAKNRAVKKTYILGGSRGTFGFTEKSTVLGCKYDHRSFFGKLPDAIDVESNADLGDHDLDYGYPMQW